MRDTCDKKTTEKKRKKSKKSLHYYVEKQSSALPVQVTSLGNATSKLRYSPSVVFPVQVFLPVPVRQCIERESLVSY
jgi:hypothetical protein